MGCDVDKHLHSTYQPQPLVHFFFSKAIIYYIFLANIGETTLNAVTFYSRMRHEFDQKKKE